MQQLLQRHRRQTRWRQVPVITARSSSKTRWLDVDTFLMWTVRVQAKLYKHMHTDLARFTMNGRTPSIYYHKVWNVLRAITQCSQRENGQNNSFLNNNDFIFIKPRFNDCNTTVRSPLSFFSFFFSFFFNSRQASSCQLTRMSQRQIHIRKLRKCY